MIKLRKLFLIFFVLSSSFLFAEKLRVAYYPYTNFMHGISDSETKSGYGYEYLQELATHTGWTYEYVYGDYEFLLERFKNGEIDLFPGAFKIPENEGKMLFPKYMMGIIAPNFYEDNRDRLYYLAVRKDRPDLVGKIESVVKSINEADPYFIQNLQYKYFVSKSKNIDLDRSDILFLAGMKSLRIGYIKNFSPFCEETVTGEVNGLLRDLTTTYFSHFGIQNVLGIEYKAFDNYNQLVKAIQNDEIDIAFPLPDDFWYAEQSGVFKSKSFASFRADIVYREGYTETEEQKIALVESDFFQRYYADTIFNVVEYQYYRTIEECLNAVLNGNADCTILNVFKDADYIRGHKYKSLKSLPLPSPASLCMGVKEGNVHLLYLINRGLDLIENDLIQGRLYEYSNMNKTFSLQEYIYDNILMFLSIVFVIVATLLAAINLYVFKMRRDSESMEEQLEIVDALSRNFLDILFIDMVHETFTLVKFEGKVQEDFENRKAIQYPYYEEIDKYIEAHVYQPDQLVVKNALSLDVIKEKLFRQNEYTYSYRMLDRDDIHNYQFTIMKVKSRLGIERVVAGFQNIDTIVSGAKERELIKFRPEIDGLTNLLNARCGRDMVINALTHNISGGMFLLVNIDDFSDINENYGHTVGDKVLVGVAECLKEAFRGGDIIVRFGGDTFGALGFRVVDDSRARRIVNDFFDGLKELKIPEIGKTNIYASAGIRILKPGELVSYEDVYAQTITNLYESKKKLGNSFTI